MGQVKALILSEVIFRGMNTCKKQFCVFQSNRLILQPTCKFLTNTFIYNILPKIQIDLDVTVLKSQKCFVFKLVIMSVVRESLNTGNLTPPRSELKYISVYSTIANP